MHFRDLLPRITSRRLPQRVNGDKYGIEIEVEGSNLPSAEALRTFWRVEQDNSLRPRPEALEYKTLVLPYKSAIKAIKLFNSTAKANKTVAIPSVRTSVHVHRNIQQLSIIDITSLVVTYMLLESSFYSIVGKEREGNLFCVPLNQCERTLKQFAAFLHSASRDNKVPIGELNAEGKKYHALNLRTMFSYGTLEFRIHEGTIDEDRLIRWVTCIENMTNYAKSRTPLEVLQDASASGLIGFGKAVLGKSISDTISYREEDFFSAVDNAHILAYAADWDGLRVKYANVNETELSLLVRAATELQASLRAVSSSSVPYSSVQQQLLEVLHMLEGTYGYSLPRPKRESTRDIYVQIMSVALDSLVLEIRNIEPEFVLPSIDPVPDARSNGTITHGTVTLNSPRWYTEVTSTITPATHIIR